MALWRVGDDHLVAVGRVFEEVVNALFFHQTADKGKVGFPVLDAIIPRLKAALELESNVQSRQHLLENVGHGHVLEDTALRPAGQQPKLRNHFHAVMGKGFIAVALAKTAADAAKKSLLAFRKGESDDDVLAQKLVKRDLRMIFGHKIQLDVKELGDPLFNREADQQQRVFAEGCGNCYWPHFLGVSCHGVAPRARLVSELTWA